MATIGDKLTVPEDGWKRIESSDKKFLLDSIFIDYSDPSLSNKDAFYIPSGESKEKILDTQIKFNFSGNKIRIIASRASAYSREMCLTIDGNDYIGSSYNHSTIRPIITFECLDLKDKKHNAILKSLDGLRYDFDAIDLDINGELYEYDENIFNEVYDLCIYKTLSENVPKNIEMDQNEIHFTEKGEIFINNYKGEMIKCGGDSIDPDAFIEFATTEDIDSLLSDTGFKETGGDL